MKNVILSENEIGMELDVVAIADWDGFDTLSDYLIENFDALLLEQLDGPESRVYTFNIGGNILSLHNNPYGNSLKAKEVSARSTLIRIHDDLEQRLA